MSIQSDIRTISWKLQQPTVVYSCLVHRFSLLLWNHSWLCFDAAPYCFNRSCSAAKCFPITIQMAQGRRVQAWHTSLWPSKYCPRHPTPFYSSEICWHSLNRKCYNVISEVCGIWTFSDDWQIRIIWIICASVVLASSTFSLCRFVKLLTDVDSHTLVTNTMQ